MKKGIFLIIGLVIVAIFAGCIGPKETAAPPTTAPPVEKVMYTGTLYVAGHGGHFAKAAVEIDPLNTASPITIKSLGKVDIGTTDTHKTQDPRVDVNNKDILYWSTYKLDPDGKVHVGKTDLTTGKVIKDVAFEPPAESQKAPWYCASGQTEKEYLPVSMSYEGYIDVYDKATLDLKHRVFVTGGDFPTDYKFHHGINTPDMKQFLLSINKADAPHGDMLGEIDLYLLDMDALVNGELKINKKNTITGAPEATITFRQTFTSDGKYILQSGRDRFYLIDGATLSVLDEEMMPEALGKQVENHDAIPTSDDKYAVITVRYPIDVAGKTVLDGQIQLYDIAKKELVGPPVSTCNACHKNLGITGSAILCGLDGVWD